MLDLGHFMHALVHLFLTDPSQVGTTWSSSVSELLLRCVLQMCKLLALCCSELLVYISALVEIVMTRVCHMSSSLVSNMLQ